MSEEVESAGEESPRKDENIENSAENTQDSPASGQEAAAAAQPDAPVKKYVVSIRYGLAGLREEFITELPDIRSGDMVVIKSSRGIDHGIALGKPREASDTITGLGEVMRKATDSDHNILDHIKTSKEPEEMRYCAECIANRKLPMDLSGIEHLFGGDKIIFYFISDGRVDFRELVKDLARRYRTRIEMRQIGVRDEARMLSDYERCGQELCCRTFLKDLEPVSMRMAKMQKSTLDPNKISGHCGRLMCCLRFEDDVYKENRKGLPNRNDRIDCEGRKGKVLNTDVLTRMVYVEFDGGEREKVHADSLKRLGRNNPPSNNSGKGQPPRNKDNRDNKDNKNNKGGCPSENCGGCGGGCGKGESKESSD